MANISASNCPICMILNWLGFSKLVIAKSSDETVFFPFDMLLGALFHFLQQVHMPVRHLLTATTTPSVWTTYANVHRVTMNKVLKTAQKVIQQSNSYAYFQHTCPKHHSITLAKHVNSIIMTYACKESRRFFSYCYKQQ